MLNNLLLQIKQIHNTNAIITDSMLTHDGKLVDTDHSFEYEPRYYDSSTERTSVTNQRIYRISGIKSHSNNPASAVCLM